MLTVVSWKWGNLFPALYVNRLQSMLARHLHRPHQLVCVTDDRTGIDPSIRCERITEFQGTPRCRRRMKQYDRQFAASLGTRILSIDLDMVIVDDITPLIDRQEPLVMWKVGYAGVYSGSFVLYDYAALHGAYAAYAADPDGYPVATGERYASDQAMINHYLRGRDVAHWTDADGFVTYHGKGYEQFEHLGVGPNQPELPPHARPAGNCARSAFTSRTVRS